MSLVLPLASVPPVLTLLLALGGHAAAQALPFLAQAEAATPQSPESATPAQRAAPSACRLRLTADLASAPSVAAIEGPGACGAEDVVRLEAVLLADRRRVAVVPPAVVRCELAEAIVHWVREDVAPAARLLKSAVKSIDNYAAYDCRGRNRIAGATLSEHGRANALDIRSVRLANGELVGLTDPRVSREFRVRLQARTCKRFSTVLGPGSDGYHEDHVHVDLASRGNGHRLCHWEVREPAAEDPSGESRVPLPRPRPGRIEG
jgi:hypothetical protein